MSSVVLTEIHGRVGLIRINRPEAMNALNNEYLICFAALHKRVFLKFIGQE